MSQCSLLTSKFFSMGEGMLPVFWYQQEFLFFSFHSINYIEFKESFVSYLALALIGRFIAFSPQTAASTLPESVIKLF